MAEPGGGGAGEVHGAERKQANAGRGRTVGIDGGRRTAFEQGVLFLNKLLPVFVLPIGLVIILVVLGTLKKWRWLVFIALGGLLIASLPVTGYWFIGRLESVHPRLKVAEAPQVDVVLVLGGIMGPPSGDGYLPNWSESIERFEGGVALMQTGKAARLLFTSAPRSTDGSIVSEGAAMRKLAIGRGVPEGQVEVTGVVGNTADEARALQQYCEQHGFKRVLLVTSAWHMPRSMRQFRKTGLEITPFPVDYRAGTADKRPLPYLDWLPNAVSGLGNTELALRECYGIAFYALTRR